MLCSILWLILCLNACCKFAHSQEIVVHQLEWNTEAGYELEGKLKVGDELQDSEDFVTWGERLSKLLNSVRERNPQHNPLLQIGSNKKTENGTESHISSQCVNALERWLQDANNRSFYALQMLDAWARPESGILEGNVRWPGHYYECMNARSAEVSGQWCVTYMGKTHPVEHPGIPLVMMWGSCFPSGCSTDDVATITERMKERYFLPQTLSTTCPNPVMQIDAIDIVAIVMTAIILALLVIGTSIDAHMRSRPDKEANFNKGTGMKLFLCFSVIRNAKQILSVKQHRGNIPILDGIRVISTTWVIFSHCFYLPMNMIDNAVHANKYYRQHGELQPLANGTLAVDSFFFISGLLVSYIVLQRMRKSGGSLHVLLLYLHRYLRLTPVYAFLLLLSMSLYKFSGYGPFWSDTASKMYHSCADGNIWIFNLLYVNNLFPAATQVCYGWSWYLANDMQFYVVAPLFLYVVYRWKIPGVVLMIAVLVGSVVVTAVLSYDMNMQPVSVGFGLLMSIVGRYFPSESENITYIERYRTDTYTTPWCRIGVYMVGMITGWLLFLKQKKLRMPKVVVLIGWLSSTAVALLLVYGTYGPVKNFTTMQLDLATFYVSVCRPVWGFCLAWVVIACTSGYGGLVTKFLDWKLFIPFSRLSYTAYLVHLLVVYWYMGTQESMLHFTIINITYIYLGTLLLTYVLAFVAALTVEWPFMEVAKLIMVGRKHKNKQIKPYTLQTRL